jgi:hypothetical protein
VIWQDIRGFNDFVLAHLGGSVEPPDVGDLATPPA